MRAPLLRDTIVRVVWPLLESQASRLERLLVGLQGEVALLRQAVAAAGGRSVPAVPFPSTPSAAQAIVLTAQGRIERSEPVMAVGGAPGRAATLSEDESGVAAFLGFAVNAADDGQPVEIWIDGPCPLFSSLNTNPVLPDSLEVYVYGPAPPVVYSGVPSGRLYRSCGTVIGPTTILLIKGDLFRTP